MIEVSGAFSYFFLLQWAPDTSMVTTAASRFLSSFLLLYYQQINKEVRKETDDASDGEDVETGSQGTPFQLGSTVSSKSSSPSHPSSVFLFIPDLIYDTYD